MRRKKDHPRTLYATRASLCCVADSSPRRRFGGRQKASCAFGRTAVGNSAKYVYTVVAGSADLTISRLHGGRRFGGGQRGFNKLAARERGAGFNKRVLH